jgi:hypothetical protein
MKEHILEFLFGESQVETEMDETREALEAIFEAAEDAPPMKIEKTPLASALKTLGVKEGNGLELDPEGFSLCFDEQPDYLEACRLLSAPEGMERLAEMGWVATHMGDVAMTGEPEGEYRIRFISIYTPEPEDKTDWPAPNPKLVADIIKKGREFATTPFERDPNNPVKDTEAGDKKKAGVGKEKDGADPEGKPKGSAKAEAMVDYVLNSVNEGPPTDPRTGKVIPPERMTPKGLGMKPSFSQFLHGGEVPEDPSADLWRCPGCHKLNCWNWKEAEDAQAAHGEEVAVATGSAFDNICGHCHQNFVHRNSPTQAEVYTHEPHDPGERKRERLTALRNRRGRTGLGPYSESLQEGRHKEGCPCNFCKNMGKGFGKKKDTEAEAEPKDTLEQLLPAPPVAETSERDVPYFDPKTKSVRSVKWVRPGKDKKDDDAEKKAGEATESLARRKGRPTTPPKDAPVAPSPKAARKLGRAFKTPKQ